MISIFEIKAILIMKLVTYQIDGQKRLGAYADQNIFDLNTCYALYIMGAKSQINQEDLNKMKEKVKDEMPTDMIGFLQLGDQAVFRAEKVLKRMADFSVSNIPKGAVFSMNEVQICAPIPKPGKILCLAGNYAEHIREGGRLVAEKEKMAPRVFMKPHTAVIGYGQPILIPKKGNKIDWEAELAVIIGKKGKYITKDEAYDYIAGYTIINDVSERELIIDADREPSEWNHFFDWLNGKWMDTFAPIGPYLVTKDEISEPHNLGIRLRVNAEIKQNSNTGNMIFNIPELIEFISRLMTLEPGDIIATGTPEGTGAASGTFLKRGDVIEVEIDKIGLLMNPVDLE
ncbi:MAG: fumarylacetoacetate hydrolase family protein [bacterium]